MQLLAAIPAVIGGGGTAAQVGTVALGATAIGTGVSALAQIRAGQQAEAVGDAQKRLADIRAQQARDEGSERYHRETGENRRRLAAIRARMAAGGTTIEGSSLDMFSESARRLETRAQDAFRVSSIDAQNETYRGTLAQWEGQQRGAAAGTAAFGTLLQGAYSYADTKRENMTHPYRTS